MAKMVSPAGEMDVKIRRVGVNKGKFFISGQIGVWDSDIYFMSDEIMHLAKSMLSFSVVRYILALPFTTLGHKLQGKHSE